MVRNGGRLKRQENDCGPGQGRGLWGGILRKEGEGDGRARCLLWDARKREIKGTREMQGLQVILKKAKLKQGAAILTAPEEGGIKQGLVETT